MCELRHCACASENTGAHAGPKCDRWDSSGVNNQTWSENLVNWCAYFDREWSICKHIQRISSIDRHIPRIVLYAHVFRDNWNQVNRAWKRLRSKYYRGQTEALKHTNRSQWWKHDQDSAGSVYQGPIFCRVYLPRTNTMQGLFTKEQDSTWYVYQRPTLHR